MKLLRFLLLFVLFIFLTATTQIGGIILLLCLPIFSFTKKKINSKFAYKSLNLLIFSILYFSISFGLIPLIAKSFGKVPLPIFGNRNIKPTNILYCVLNRHYVKPELRKATFRVADQLEKEFPNTQIKYMDGSFPLGSLRLLPHFDHSKGESLDISLFYKDKNGNRTNLKTSTSGYGIFVEPLKNERNRPCECEKEGFKQYSFTEYLTFGGNKTLKFDDKRTKRMVQLFEKEKVVRYMLLEPHVRQRMNFDSEKFRLQGCRAVRHDDHLHVRI